MSATIPSKLSNAQGVKAVIRPRTDFETSDMHIMSSSDMTLGNISIPDMPNTSCPGTCSNAMPENTFATKKSIDSVATHGDTSSESYSPSAVTQDSTKSYSGIYSVINVSRSTIGGSNATDGTSQQVSEYQFERSPLADTRKSVSSSSYQIVDSYML
ncbi:hypothetical protein BSLG_001777 [Batrachochytrium salamandrivorans]|nr:hypothetical protein BSLG_001777 [Batrachochytrium salamandrivorans]